MPVLPDSHDELQFSEYYENSGDVWLEVQKRIYGIGALSDVANLGFSVIGSLFNIFHFIVLTRKSMRTLTINAFLAGIALCDLLRMLCVIAQEVPFTDLLYLQPNVPDQCVPPPLYITMLTTKLCQSTGNIAQQLAVWYAVTIAVMRAIVIRYPLSSRITSLTETKCGVRPLFIVTIIILPFWIISFSEDYFQEYAPWYAPSECTMYPENYTQPQYYYDTTHLAEEHDVFLHKISLIFEGVICKIIPCLLLPIATILLVWELKKSKRRCSSTLNTENKDRSTKLIIYMTTSFLLASIPLGLLSLVQVVLINQSVELVLITDRFSSFFTFINVVNGTIHFLICFFMSKQYQDTVRAMFGIKAKVKESSNESNKDT